MTISSPAGSPGLSPDFVEEFDLNPPVKEGVEDDGSKIILGFDTTADALLAFNQFVPLLFPSSFAFPWIDRKPELNRIVC